MAKLSVIIPVHNMQEYLDKCMESVLNQTMSDLEIILVEDASTDASPAMCDEYVLKDSRIKVLHLDVGDLATARNSGVAVATSEYVAFVDSDDTVDPQMYESLYTKALEHNLDIVYSSYVKVFDNGSVRNLYVEDGNFTECDTKQILASHYLQKFPTSACTMIARRTLFDEIKFPEFQYYEDRATTFRLLAACSRAGLLNKAFYHYYQRVGSIVYTPTWKHYYDYCHSEGERLKFLYDSDLFDDQEKGRLAKLSATWLLRKLRHLRKLSQTPDQKSGFRQMKEYIRYIPQQCSLSFKMKVYKRFFNMFYR